MSSDKENKSFAINEWRVDPHLNRLSRAGEVIKVDPQNMKVLELLASRPGEVFSQTEIEQQAWSGVIVTPNSVYQSIAQLRKALGDNKTHPRYIETIARKGYRLIGKVEVPCSSDVASLETHSGAAVRKPERLVVIALLCVLLVLVAGAYVRTTAEPAEGLTPDPARVTGTVHYSAQESAGVRAARLLAMGDVALQAGYAREALHHYEGALQALDGMGPEAGPVRAEHLAKIATAHLWNDDPQRAAEVARQALSILEESAPNMHPSFVVIRRTLGEALLDDGRYAEAEAQLLASLELSGALYGEQDVDTLQTKDALTSLYVAQRNWNAALELSHELLQQALRVRANETDTAAYLTRYARILYEMGEYSEALEQANAASELLRKAARADHQFVGSAKQLMADILVRTGDYKQAERLARESLQIWKKNDSQPWRSARAASTLGESLLRQGKLSQAEQYLSYAATILGRETGYMQVQAREENDRRMSDLRSAKGAAVTD